MPDATAVPVLDELAMLTEALDRFAFIREMCDAYERGDWGIAFPGNQATAYKDRIVAEMDSIIDAVRQTETEAMIAHFERSKQREIIAPTKKIEG